MQVIEFRKRENREQGQIFLALLRIKDKNFSRFGERHKFTGLVNSGNPKQDKYEENHKQAHHSQISEPEISRKP